MMRGDPADGAIGVVVFDTVADLVLEARSLDWGIGVVAVVDAPLAPETVELLGSWREVPVMVVADAARGP